MAVDKDYIERFEKELKVLKRLQDAVNAAVDNADKRLADMQNEAKK